MSRKRPTGGSHMISGVFVFLLIGIFAIASITLVLSGIGAYRNVTNAAARNTERQLALSYLANKVRAYDGAGSVSVDTRDGISVLSLREDWEGETYETLIYHYDGAICEQYTSADGEFVPMYGERLTEALALQFNEVRPDLMQVEATLSDGSVYALHMALRTSQVR